MGWDALLTKVRNRRDRLEAPSPAHDLVIEAIEKIQRDEALMVPPSTGFFLIKLFITALDVAHTAEVHAAETGLLRDRQLAAEALTFALAVARRSVEEGVRAESTTAGRW